MPLKLPQDAQDALKRLLVAHSEPCQFQRRGRSNAPVDTVFEMFGAYKAAGFGEDRFRFDLLDAVPHRIRRDQFYDHFRIYDRDGLNLNDTHLDAALRKVLKNLFQVHVPDRWNDKASGEYAEVIDWKMVDGARLVTLRTRDGREIEGPEDDLSTQFYHKVISPDHKAEFIEMVQGAISDFPEATGHSIWDVRYHAVQMRKPLEDFLKKDIYGAVPRQQRLDWERKTGASSLSPSLVPLLRSAVGPAFVLTVPQGQHAGKEGGMAGWRRTDGQEEVQIDIEGVREEIWVPAADLTLPWDMPSASPAPR
jgi:hypothetical protein